MALAIFVMIPYNLLMLDEPSNHLGESIVHPRSLYLSIAPPRFGHYRCRDMRCLEVMQRASIASIAKLLVVPQGASLFGPGRAKQVVVQYRRVVVSSTLPEFDWGPLSES